MAWTLGDQLLLVGMTLEESTMRPSILCGLLVVGYIAWLLARRVYRFVIGRRSLAWRAIVAVCGASWGWAPAMDGALVGYGLIALAGAATLSLLHDLWERFRDARSGRRAEDADVNAADNAGLVAELNETPLTELDQAAVHMEMLRSHMHYLERAHRGEHLEAERVFAGEVALSARRLHDALAVVVNERRLLNP